MVDINVRIAGAAGQGLLSAGKFLGKTCVRAGYHVFGVQDSMSRIRGGHNNFQLRISDHNVVALTKGIDVLVTLHPEDIENDFAQLKDKSIALLDSETIKVKPDDSRVIDVPFKKTAMKKGGKPIFSNSVAIGFVVGLLDLDISILNDLFNESFSKEDVAKGNIDSAAAGFELGQQAHKERGDFLPGLKTVEAPSRMFLNGNEAAALGAIAAGMKFISCYPMSPSTGIITYISHHDTVCSVVVEQAEDEIAAVNQAVGASVAGVRAMTASSGGGMALMSETISLCGIAEIPLVIINCQRGGPGTGLPTRTEQSDLHFVIYTGHGEFPRAVFAPANAEEAFYLTAKAFNIADKYQIPVTVLSDQHIADSFYTVDKFDVDKIEYMTSVASKDDLFEDGSYKRYLITESGISPRAIPGMGPHLVMHDSHEHTEDAHITEDALVRNAMVEKRARKTANLSEDFSLDVYGNDKCETVFVSWGSTGDALRETVKILDSDGVKLKHIQMTELWPFPASQFEKAVEGSSRIIFVEGNSTGQLASIVKGQTKINDVEMILKYDGRPFNTDDLMTQLKGVL
ncbi:MAG: 2-oxoacid:acceptor oxidoreductase subunit alpha [Deltaproteobacteria bacterium]|nr:2-oxoacid:acceptor oxidoreductase subunit alpha [Deltaproteobacteria bacterium]